VLITSRNPAWGGLARRLPVDVLPEAEAVALLLGQTGSQDRATAVALAPWLRPERHGSWRHRWCRREQLS
jgi:hypothetical protein